MVDVTFWALSGGARKCCCALLWVLSAVWFEDVEPWLAISPPSLEVVDSIPRALDFLHGHGDLAEDVDFWLAFL